MFHFSFVSFQISKIIEALRRRQSVLGRAAQSEAGICGADFGTRIGNSVHRASGVFVPCYNTLILDPLLLAGIAQVRVATQFDSSRDHGAISVAPW